MPRYLFETSDPEPSPGPAEVELPGPQEAREEALRTAAQMLKDFDGQFWGSPGWQMRVTDEEGRIVCTLAITGETGEP